LRITHLAPETVSDEFGEPDFRPSPFSEAYSFLPEECFYRHVHVSVVELKKAFPASAKAERRGTPPKFKWDELYLHLFGKLWGDGWTLEDKKRLLDEALEWAAVEWGDDAPSDRQVRTKVKDLIEDLKECEKPDVRRPR
jgi:hypothetical protein